LRDLTVPPDRLPPGCQLAPPPTTAGGNQGAAWWAGLPLPSNPWSGTDQALIVTIRARMGGALQASGPPLDPRAPRPSLPPAADVEEAYAAVYLQSASESIAVYATRTASTGKPPQLETAPRVQRVPRIAIGPITAVVSGQRDECSFAIESYLRSLSDNRSTVK
jgi:hypothetical protein